MGGKGRVVLEERLYNYEECARVWQRVSPQLNPYPQVRLEGEGQLPGAQEDPCCMGTEALESVEVLRGFVREELCAQQRFARLASQCRDASLRQCFAGFSRLAARRAKRLLSALYLITGEEYCPELSCERMHWEGRREMLRALYHDAACGGFNYERAAQETTDGCLASLLGSFSQEEYRRAEQILDLLAKSL